MNNKSYFTHSRISVRLIVVIMLVTTVFGSQALFLATDAQASPSNAPADVPADAPLAQGILNLSVVSARTEPPWVAGDPITEYKYLINVDNTGNPGQDRNAGCHPSNPGYPDSCDWPSIREVPGAAPIYTQGDQSDFSGGLTLPDGKYLISVMAEGFKLGGANFSVPLGGPLTVQLQPHPLPPATIRIKVFEDISPVNGQFDAPAEAGLAGFTAVLNDTVGQISTDVFGNPLCTTYDGAGNPNGQTNCLVSDANGDIVVPNLGPLRYDVLVNSPEGELWYETTTLEGSWSWDTWLQEGGTGLDNEFVVAGEPFPWTVFGFVRPMNALGGGSGGVSGTLVEASIYLPQQGALPYFGDIWNGFQGTKVTGPITDGIVALSDLQNGDTAVYVAPANPDGTFSISGVPDGNYLFTWWDYNLLHILDWIQITVSNGQMYDLGTPFLTGWFTKVEGYVFVDQNKNGVKDPGEPGKADYLVVLRDRDNSEIDRQSISSVTGHDGYYVFEKAYPMGSWMVLEAYNDRYYTTGITYQVDNQPEPTTVLGNGVDVGLLPILGQPARLDWGIHPYEAGTNGGIVGSVFYDTTRNELDPQYQAVEPWAAGIPNLTMNLYEPVLCGTPAFGYISGTVDGGGPTYDSIVLADGPAYYYRLGESAGPTAADETGGSDGTYGSTVTLPATGLLSNSMDSAAGFDGTADSYVDTNVTTLSDSAFSVEAWVNADVIGTAGRRIVVKDEVGVTGAWLLWFNQGALRFQVRNSTNSTWVIAQAPTTPSVGTTFHAVGVFDGTDAILYLDGVEVARTALGTATANTNGLPITIGADSDPLNPRDHIFDGTIDEVAIYESALTGVQIQAHFDAANASLGMTMTDSTADFTGLDYLVGGTLNNDTDGSSCTIASITATTITCVAPLSGGTDNAWEVGDAYSVNTTAAPCDPLGINQLAFDGSYAKGQLLNTTTTEIWEQPTDCIARDANGVPLPYGTPNQEVLPIDPTGKRCLEGPLMGTQLQSGFASLDGNWGFGDGCFGEGNYAISEGVCAIGDPTPLGAGDYLVEVEPGLDATGRPLYQVVGEEDINVFGGDQFIPAVPPPSCAGPLHTVDVAGVGADGPDAVDNPSFADAGGSPFEGQLKPTCEVKLVNLANGKSVAPLFTLFTEVPIPGKWKGYIIDDLTVSTDPLSLNFGEKAGLPNSPIGIYDFTNKLLTTIRSDPNGVFEVLLPSTYSMNCPTPSGVCANVYYMLGNDPGQPGALNPNYNPHYRTIGASFEIYPGLILPSDLAPTQIVPGVLAAGSLFGSPPQCTLNDPLNPTTPELFAVSQPYVNGSGAITIDGQGFGGASGIVTLDGTAVPSSAWSATQVVIDIPAGTAVGAHQMEIISANGNRSVNGLTVHVLGAGYNPSLYEVGPGYPYATIQSAIDAAATAGGDSLVVVYPDTPTLWNPLGVYYENLVMYSPIKLQGVGPGGIYQNGTPALGSSVDGRGVAGDTGYADVWRALVTGLTWDGNQAIYEGAVVYIVAEDGEFANGFNAAIDGFTIQGGDQQGFPNNLVPGDPTQQVFAAVQGGGIFANAYARYLQISNNVMQSNGGAYAGAIRIGTPHLAGAFNDNQNEFMTIANNRILANGGTNLAGAIGIFSGADNYEIAGNDICGNFSAEYGGGISHYGYSPNGTIHDNRIYFNRAYDEGGGVMIAGELPADPGLLTPGAGPVDVFNNLIQANLGNDDGGGLRFLMAGNFPYNVYNNIIVNNVSTHEGGGVSLNDTPDVRFFNNTVMKNITTATAVTSNGFPAPAGLSSSSNSNTLQATLPGGSPLFSDPLLFNNIFWDNRAGSFTGGTVASIGLPGDPNPIFNWDMGVAGGSGLLAPTNTLLQVTTGTIASGSNNNTDPMVVETYDTSVQVFPWRGNPRFVDILMVSALADPNLLGDYHLMPGSPAIDLGAASKSGVNAPATDIDNGARPAGAGFDSGADEFGAGAPNPAAPTLYFSTVGNSNPPGVTGSADNADIYDWNGTAFSRVFDATGVGLPGNANVDGLMIIDVNHFYLSFSGTLTFVPGLGYVEDEDVVEYNNGAWSLYFDGTAQGLTANGHDLDAINILGNTLYFSTVGNANVGGLGSPDNADIYAWDGASFSRVWDATANGLPGSANVDGVVMVDATHFYLSFSSTTTTVPSLGAVEDEDVVEYNNGVWSVYFDGTAQGLTSNAQDLDAFSIGASAPPPPPPPPPGPAFPATLVLDDFNRGGGNVSLGANWSGTFSQTQSAYRINTYLGERQVQVRTVNGGGLIYWNQTTFGANQEAYFTFTDPSSIATEQNLVLKRTGASTAMIEALYDLPGNQVQIWTLDPTNGWVLHATFSGVGFALADQFGARTLQDGTVTVYKNGALVGTTNVTSGPNPWPTALAQGGGQIGVWFANTTGTTAGDAHFDNFGGGTMP